jgi:hypothetical protein
MLNSATKARLADTIRALRARLLRDLQDATESRFRLALRPADAGLDEASAARRSRVERWLDEAPRQRDFFLKEAHREAAATLLNRLVLVRHLEALGLSRPAVVTGGWRSPGYMQFRAFSPGLCGDDTEGYRLLLRLLFDELSLELSALFADDDAAAWFPVPSATLRAVVEALDDPALAAAWRDDTTLGWVYQFWNDPDRESLDRKLADGGKIAPGEIAAKTQMFTERYAVEWLLQQGIGQTWLAICAKNGWEADAAAVVAALDERRAAWRARREAGEVEPSAPMPIEGEQEARWRYFVPGPLPAGAIERAPRSICDLKLLDPACGSGHFLVIAFELLVPLHREEARLRGSVVSDREIAEAIVERNLFGADLDHRALQIAAAGLLLKARSLAAEARPSRVNLAAPPGPLGELASPGAALEAGLERHTGLAPAQVADLVGALAGAEHLGSLLRVGGAVRAGTASSWKLLEPAGAEPGLRSAVARLAAAVGFLGVVQEGAYDLVVGNPPYQGTQRLVDNAYLDRAYPASREDLYAAFLERSLELVRPSGLACLITMRGWLFVSHFRALREKLLDTHDLAVLADLGVGAFEAAPGVEAAMVVVRRGRAAAAPSAAMRCDGDKASELLCPPLACSFEQSWFRSIPGTPVVYDWSRAFIERYASLPKLGDVAPARVGMKTSDNARFVRRPWEVRRSDLDAVPSGDERRPRSVWIPYIKGASGKAWIEPLSDVVRWQHDGLEIRLALQRAYGQGPQCERMYFVPGVAFTTIARRFLARAHRYRSIFDVAGSSVFPGDIAGVVCLLNSRAARGVVEALNPTINFQVGDVNRLPMFPVEGAREIYAALLGAFAEHEAGREGSIEFVRPGPSRWRAAQAWAQRAVDRPAGAALEPFLPEADPAPAASEISFALGVALGRFDARGGAAVEAERGCVLPGGIMFLSQPAPRDSLDHPACAPLRAAWSSRGGAVGGGDDLGAYLRRSFFAHHCEAYEGRPIYFPLSSAKRSFVAWVSIHRWQEAPGGPGALDTLLADHLLPELRRLEGELADLRAASARGERGEQRPEREEKRAAEARRLIDELSAFIGAVTVCAQHGPPATAPGEPRREQDARFVFELDDGVAVSSAALWPLLEPQWKEPKRWWRELACASGRKEYDWSSVAARYFPARVAARCRTDPSLAASHRCLWRYHPEEAYAWELRLGGAPGPASSLDEPGSDQARGAFLTAHPERAAALARAEAQRRDRRRSSRGRDEAESGSH